MTQKQKLLTQLVSKNYVELTTEEEMKMADGAQLWDDKWWAPIYGCDTLSNLIEDLEDLLESQLAFKDTEPPV